MTRPPVGTVTQPRSDTALFAHVAMRLENVQVERLEEWARELGIRIGVKALREAPQTTERLLSAADAGRAVHRWALIDYAALNFFTALVTLRVERRERMTLSRLEQVSGVVDLLAVEHSREVLALVIFERLSDKRVLEGVLGEFGDIVDWRPIEEQRPRAAIGTFRSLALAAAGRERLLIRSSAGA
jgi:hypothetical protein